MKQWLVNMGFSVTFLVCCSQLSVSFNRRLTNISITGLNISLVNGDDFQTRCYLLENVENYLNKEVNYELLVFESYKCLFKV